MMQRYAVSLATIRSYRGPMQRAVDEVVNPRIKENFRSETAAGESSWEPLAEWTAFDRQAMGLGGQSPKLRRKNRLYRTATTRRAIWTFRGQGSDPAAFIDMGALNSRVPYAEYHQIGTYKMPARPYLVINDKDVKEIEEIFADHLEKRELAAGMGIAWAAYRVGVRR